jgi:PAS domain S-box-containing protein
MGKILISLRKWLSPPVFEDPERYRRARSLNKILLSIPLILVVSVAINLFAGRTSWLIFSTHLIGIFAALGLWVLLRRGHLRITIYGLILMVWLLVTLFTVWNGTARSPAISLYILVIVVGGLLINTRAVVWITALCSVSLLGLVLAENVGWLPPPDVKDDLILWASYTMIFSMSAIVVRLAARDIVTSLKHARHELAERRKIEDTLRDSEGHYRNFIEHSFEGVWQLCFDAPIPLELPPEEQVRRIQQQGYIADCNNALANMYGLASREQMLGSRLRSLYGETIPDQNTRATLELVQNAYRSKNRETREVNARGETVYFLNNSVGVIENGELVELWGSQRDVTEQKKIEAALQHRSDQLVTLNSIGTSISSLQNLQGVLKEILEQLQPALPLDVFYIGLFDPQTGLISFPMMYDSGRFWQEAPQPMLEGSLVKKVITTRQPILVNRTPEELEAVRTKRTDTHPIGDVQQVSASMLMAPMYAGELISGLVSVQSYLLNAYTQEHLDFLALASFQIAVAIENAQLYENLQKELVDRQKAEAEVRLLNEELEQRVHERTGQLETAVKELEAFSYSVSHDLRAPLRAIDGYSRLLMDDYAGLLDADGLQFLENVRISTQRMGALIDDLLKLSRVSRAELNRETVSLSGIAGEIVTQLCRREAGRQIEITIQPGITAEGDPNLLHLALENLLDNAWKFTGREPTAQIKFGSRELEGERVYYVQDNGAGFDMRYASRLFEAFQRLHSQEEYEGTGVGLATVKRIIQRHGGRIWTEAEAGVGATFYFTLG